ncbi:hypothetical protein HYU91_04535 [Candidatus Collierbacteria bacterium]|nr:hypothetical protein [Candidatus Collierbacteria bacterium]
MARIDVLLDLAQRPGVTADEAYMKADVTESDETGERSLVLVEKILKDRPEVFKSFERTARGSEPDREGRDINVRLKRKWSFRGFREFSIEVKSSPGGVDEFRYNLNNGTKRRVRGLRIKALGLEGAIDEYLHDKRIIILDASQPALEANLMREFGLLRQYQKDQSRENGYSP